MSTILSIAFAGVIGVLLRYFLSAWIDERVSGYIPWGTLLVNLIGCFAAGFLFHFLAGRSDAPQSQADTVLRIALMTGFLGGFTTFSAYSVQTLTMFRDGQWVWAALNIGISNIGGIALAWAGYTLSRSL